MGAGFLDALCDIAGIKDYVTNTSRLKDGVDYCIYPPKVDERQLTLTFTISGVSPDDYNAKRKAFFGELYKGDVSVVVPAHGNEIFRLKYRNSTGVYAQNTERTFGKVGCKFTEPNPNNRA